MIYLYEFVIPKNILTCDYEIIFKAVSKERQQQINKYLFEEDKRRSLFAELLLQYILNVHFHVKTFLIEYETQYGKPKLSDYSNIYFNWSHSGDWVLCAVGECEIGVDVEKIMGREIMDIAKRFYSLEEYEYLHSRKKEERNEYFYKLWTLKESYIKAIGKGLTIPLNSFSFELRKKIVVKEKEKIIRNYTFWSERLDKDYVMALCCNSSIKRKLDVKRCTISYEKLFEWVIEGDKLPFPQ